MTAAQSVDNAETDNACPRPLTRGSERTNGRNAVEKMIRSGGEDWQHWAKSRADIFKNRIDAGFVCLRNCAGVKWGLGWKDPSNHLTTTNFNPALILPTDNLGILMGVAGNNVLGLDFDFGSIKQAPLNGGPFEDRYAYMLECGAFRLFRETWIKAHGQDEAAFTAWLRSCLVVWTPKGGFHIYCRMITDSGVIKTGTKLLLADDGSAMDARWNGGQLAGPLSFTAEWRDQAGEIKTAQGFYRFAWGFELNVADLSEVSAELQHAIGELRGKHAHVSAPNIEPQVTSWQQTAPVQVSVPDGILPLSTPIQNYMRRQPGKKPMIFDRDETANEVLEIIRFLNTEYEKRASVQPFSPNPLADHDDWFRNIVCPMAHELARLAPLPSSQLQGEQKAKAEATEREWRNAYDQACKSTANYIGTDWVQFDEALRRSRSGEVSADEAVTLGTLIHNAEQMGWRQHQRDNLMALVASQNATAQQTMQSELGATTSMTIATPEPEPWPWERPEAQSDTMTLAGAAYRFVAVRNLNGNFAVIDLQDPFGRHPTLEKFARSFSMLVDTGQGNKDALGAILKKDIEKRSPGRMGIFTFVDAVTFDPRRPPATTWLEDGRTFFNLFLGLGVERYQPLANPERYCSRLLEYFEKVLGHPDTDPDQYIWKWLAWCVQNVGHKSAVAIVLRGEQGSGKSTFQNIMQGLFGPYSFTTGHSSQLFGRFAGQIAHTLHVGCNEALWANNGAEVDSAKALITDALLALERKYHDAAQMMTFMNVVITTNHDFAAPVYQGDRRHAVFDMDNLGLLSPDTWKAIDQTDLRPGSLALAALWQILKAYPLDGWVPRYNIPKNSARARQKVEALGGTMASAMLHLLDTDEVPGARPDDDWDVSSVKVVGKVGKNQVRRFFRDWWKALPMREKKGKLTKEPSDKLIANALRDQLGVNMNAYGPDGKERAWEFPDRATCKDNFERYNDFVGGLD